MSEELTGAEKRTLLRLARRTLQCHYSGNELPEPEELTEHLLQARGAFVTITEQGVLRGCIGHVVGVEPLWRSVRGNAMSAALRDPRFPPVAAHELDQMDLEISALTPLAEVEDVDEIEVGRDGIMIERGSFRGLLLPQVAQESGWDLPTFLDQTCRKAGLMPGCWRDERVTISRFSAEVFSELELGR